MGPCHDTNGSTAGRNPHAYLAAEPLLSARRARLLSSSAPGFAFGCARRSWRGPAGASPAQERGSARLVASVAAWKVTTTAKRTQQSCGVCIEPRKEL